MAVQEEKEDKRFIQPERTAVSHTTVSVYMTNKLIYMYMFGLPILTWYPMVNGISATRSSKFDNKSESPPISTVRVCTHVRV